MFFTTSASGDDFKVISIPLGVHDLECLSKEIEYIFIEECFLQKKVIYLQSSNFLNIRYHYRN